MKYPFVSRKRLEAEQAANRQLLGTLIETVRQRAEVLEELRTTQLHEADLAHANAVMRAILPRCHYRDPETNTIGPMGKNPLNTFQPEAI